jgi:hypothetical protein
MLLLLRKWKCTCRPHTRHTRFSPWPPLDLRVAPGELHRHAIVAEDAAGPLGTPIVGKIKSVPPPFCKRRSLWSHAEWPSRFCWCGTPTQGTLLPIRKLHRSFEPGPHHPRSETILPSRQPYRVYHIGGLASRLWRLFRTSASPPERTESTEDAVRRLQRGRSTRIISPLPRRVFRFFAERGIHRIPQ